MCGIAGLVSNCSSVTADRETLRLMCDAISHRGPDDEGYFFSGPVGLGIRRLSIIDLATGHQPIHNEDSTVQLVFNGEIYNYLELRPELEARGHKFYTQTDTEVIVHAYEEYGEACVEKLRGMFGLALWDERQQSLLLAIDRFGIKPLYYSVSEEGIIFGSELKSLLVAPPFRRREIDFGALAQYFALGYIPPPATIYKSTRKLSPGCVLRWTAAGGAVVRPYWDLSNEHIDRGRPPAETRDQLRAALKDAVRSHMISDVPVGAFLSGGIDSSIVVALMSEVSTAPVKTFSIGFAHREHNELGLARLVAERFSTEHCEWIIEPETVDVLPDLVASFDEPFADPSALPTYYVAKMAKEFVKVALSGDGGDELFVGYTIFRGLELSRYLQLLPASLLKVMAALPGMLPQTKNPGWNDRIARWSKQATDSVQPPDRAFRSKLTPAGSPGVWSLLSSELQEQLAGHNPYLSVDEWLARYTFDDRAHPLEQFLQTVLKVSLAGDMLVKVDRMSMKNSLEVRVPLLDHVLAEFVASVPVKQRFPGWRLKGLLRDTMADVLPRAILNHPKHGFTIPLADWFRGDLAQMASDILLSNEAGQRGFINTAEVEKLLQSHRQGRQNLSSVIWSLLIFELWCRRSAN